ncbi:uncharacterized protein LOC142340476 [Convolutriloba macropyga]|uniref:uncharacterized protein LOC142340476 n=1 Tax=Convolutriloba macropyga TaxID=536237 RepID=UPI003F523B7B
MYLPHREFAISKTKVASIKMLSIPKLELEAGTLGEGLGGFCECKITTIITLKHFVTDSIATFGPLQSNQRQKMYLAYRLIQIIYNFNPNNWRHIPRNLNTADHGTPGHTSSRFPKLWLETANFLSTAQGSWNSSEDSDHYMCARQTTQPQMFVIGLEKLST